MLKQITNQLKKLRSQLSEQLASTELLTDPYFQLHNRLYEQLPNYLRNQFNNELIDQIRECQEDAEAN